MSIVSLDRHLIVCFVFFFQAEDGIRDLVRSRGLGDVYKRQGVGCTADVCAHSPLHDPLGQNLLQLHLFLWRPCGCLLYTSDAADERSSVDLGGRRIIKKKNTGSMATWLTSEHCEDTSIQ